MCASAFKDSTYAHAFDSEDACTLGSTLVAGELDPLLDPGLTASWSDSPYPGSTVGGGGNFGGVLASVFGGNSAIEGVAALLRGEIACCAAPEPEVVCVLDPLNEQATETATTAATASPHEGDVSGIEEPKCKRESGADEKLPTILIRQHGAAEIGVEELEKLRGKIEEELRLRGKLPRTGEASSTGAPVVSQVASTWTGAGGGAFGAPVVSPVASTWSTSAGSCTSDRSDLVDRPETPVDGGQAWYTGQWLGDSRHGRGTVTWTSGQRYEGQFNGDLFHGRGVFEDADGSKYKGRWDQGEKHGYGVYVHSDGTTYEGQWRKGAKSGSGMEQWTDGTRFEGEYLNGNKHGRGVYKGVDGSEYVGGFVEDLMQGEGIYTFADGRRYAGQWLHGQMHGHGRTEWPSGTVYEGSYRAGAKSGSGTLTYPDGRSYAGGWRSGRQHGEGVRDDGRGRRVKETWHEGKLIPASASMNLRIFGYEQ
mmetsp:Transcript_39597/g.99556  ORF Transcript_39597/g.99556 Transcript_39597/m.99556 type:complete len:479 (-) Transcript_39597:126-1562(-)